MLFIDLNDIVAARFEQVGRDVVHEQYFTPQDHTHTTGGGPPRSTPQCVVAGIRAAVDCDLKKYLKPPSGSASASAAGRLKFSFGKAAAGCQQVQAEDVYSAAQGYGFEPCHAATNHNGSGHVGSEPFYFSVQLPPGNYRVGVTTPGGEPMTIRAELRRLMVEASCGTVHEFNVNVRTPAIGDGRAVRLKDREKTTEAWAWDEKLTLEIAGPRPTVSTIEIEPAKDLTTIFLLGDSTVADQPREPWGSWGQMLPRFFDTSVAVANHSESGESIRSSLAAGRFDKVFAEIAAGDYLMLQFGHNDMKDQSPGGRATYRENLTRLVAKTRRLGRILCS